MPKSFYVKEMHKVIIYVGSPFLKTLAVEAWHRIGNRDAYEGRVGVSVFEMSELRLMIARRKVWLRVNCLK